MTLSPSDASLPFRDPAWVVDAEMRVISCSDAAEGALGMARRDMTGRPLRDLIADGHVLGPLLEAAAGNGAAGPVAATLRSAREARPSAVRALALGSGAAGCLLVVASHETWESPEQARPPDERDRTVGDASTGLSQTQHLTALGELAGEVAHEFGNILQAIGLHVAALRRQPGLPEAVGRSLGAIKQAVDTGHGYTRRLVTFARDDGGRMERLDIAPVLRDVVQLLESRILHEGRPVRLQVSIDPLPEVAGNRSKLSEAFLNVLLNALEAMPEGGAIEVSAVESGGEVRVAIRDTGRGMTPEECHRAFDPFFTTHPASSGLGLSTVYGIVRTHGGSVFIESEPGRGTAVSRSLPTAEPPVLAWRARGNRAGRALGRALVVADHLTVREATADLLAQEGYDVARASTVSEALAALATERFALVVTDVGLPDRPGWDITRAVKDQSPDTLVVLVSGWGAQLSAGEAQARGADLVFEKPIDPEALIAAIHAPAAAS